MTTPLISVIVSTYNSEKTLFWCLASLACQNIDKSIYEVIIVDNNSKDRTLEIIQKFVSWNKNFKYANENAHGLNYSRNRGLEEALGQYIAYIDDDSEAYDDWINEMHKIICNYIGIEAVGGSCERYGINNHNVPPSFEPEKSGNDDIDKPLEKNEWTSYTNMVFKKETLIRYGGFKTGRLTDENKLDQNNETYLFTRMKADGVKFFYDSKMKVRLLARESWLKLCRMLLSFFFTEKI